MGIHKLIPRASTLERLWGDLGLRPAGLPSREFHPNLQGQTIMDGDD